MNCITKIIFQEMTFYINTNDHLLLASFNKLFVCLADEGTGAAFSFGGMAVDSLLLVELFVAFGAFHLASGDIAIDYYRIFVRGIDILLYTALILCYLCSICS